MNQILSCSETPDWFHYPEDFLRIVIGQKLLDFDPWIVLQGDHLRVRFKGLAERYPNRDLVPFARREDNDDVACWEKDREGVVIVHDYASPGYEHVETLDSFSEWLLRALNATIDYD